MSRYNEINIQHFANLVKELKINLLTQEEFDNAIEELYMAIFRHNTKGEYVSNKCGMHDSMIVIF